MSDILIKGMKMPDKMYTIDTCRDANGVLQANCGDGTGWHDVVEVPTHERLIVKDMLDSETRVIEASENGEDKAGEWINLGHRPGILKHPYSVDYKCPFCDYEQYTVMFLPPKKCPRCGARLVVECKEGETDGKL